MHDTVQQHQPDGVPPLELTGERTLPDVPAENYWFRRHLAVYEWVAERCAGLDVVDMACGEGYGTDVLARRARQVTGVDANPEAHDHASAKYTRPGVRFARDLIETYIQPCDAVVFLQTIEHVKEPEKVLAHFKAMAPVGYVSTPNVLTLAPEGAEKSDNPWHLREYRAQEFRALCESVYEQVDLYGVFHARKLKAHELALRAGWDRMHAALGITKPFYDRFTPAISARDFVLRRGRSRPGAGLRRGAALSSARPGALALVLHSHMPYVEGFGTWPFGEEWLWEAVACVYLPLLDLLDGAPVTVGADAGAVRPARGHARRAGRPLPDVPARDPRADPRRRLRRPRQRRRARAGRRGAPRRRRLHLRRGGLRAPRPGPARRLRGSSSRVELWTSTATHALLPMLATDAGLRLQLATGRASHVRRFGDWGGGFWLPECAYAPGLERDLADHGVRAFCVDQTKVEGFDHLRPVATEAGPVAVPIDWATVELVWNDRDGYPVHDTYRDYHRRTVHDLRPWDNAGRPYDREAALALARDHARDFVERAVERVAGRRAALLRAGHRAARPLVVRGAGLAGGRAGGGAPPGPRSGTVARASSAPRPSRSSWRPRPGAPARTCRPGIRRAVGQIAIAAAATSCAPSRPPPATRAARRAGAGGARAAGRPGERLGLHGHPRAGRRLPARAARGPRSGLDAALGALTDSAAVPQASVRNLAPDLDLAALTSP